jgi:hypothetical protein
MQLQPLPRYFSSHFDSGLHTHNAEATSKYMEYSYLSQDFLLRSSILFLQGHFHINR